MVKRKVDNDIVNSSEAYTGSGDPDLDAFRKELKKEFGDSTAMTDDDFVTSFIPTGIDPLDYYLGGGIARGRMSEIVGSEGCGKSSFGIYMLGQIQKQNGLGVLIDTENGSGDAERFRLFGVDTKKCIITVEDLAEKAFSQIERVANYIQKKNIKTPSLVVLDSVAGLTTRSELEAEYDAGGYPATARMIKKGIQRCKLMCKETDLAVLFINQTRVKMGGMVNPFTGPTLSSPGGDTLKFQAITRILLDRGKFLGDSKLPNGHVVKAKIIKCKTSASLGRVLPMRFYYDERGYHNPSIVFDVINDSGSLGTGAWKTITLPDGSEKKFNSADTFIELFEASEENRQHFLKMMKDCFAKNMNFGLVSDIEEQMPTLDSE